MKKSLMLAVVVAMLVSAAGVGLVFPVSAGASDMQKALGPEPSDQGFKLIHASDLAALMAKGDSNLYVYDANHEDFRKKNGIIPGAHLLDSSSKYDVAKVLPKSHQAQLVFYCANTQCMASHAAAERAVKAGYTNVSVMADGLLGWKDSGHQVAMVSSSTKSSL